VHEARMSQTADNGHRSYSSQHRYREAAQKLRSSSVPTRTASQLCSPRSRRRRVDRGFAGSSTPRARTEFRGSDLFDAVGGSSQQDHVFRTACTAKGRYHRPTELLQQRLGISATFEAAVMSGQLLARRAAWRRCERN